MAGKVTTQLVIDGKNNTGKAFQEVEGQLRSLNSMLRSTGQQIAGALSFGALVGSVKAVVSTADAYQLMNARLKLATGSQEEFNRAQQELQRIAVATGAPVSSLIALYGRISRPLKEAGRTQADILKVTEAVSTAFRVSGASAQEAENGVVQFAQALGSGALRGDEFNSVAEQAPRLMQALADGIGQPVSALKDLAAEGKLTADVVTTALIGQLPKLQQELAGFGDTVGSEVVALQDTLQRGFGNATTGPLIEALKELRAALNDPKMQENLTILASALVRLAEAAVKGGATLGGVGDDLGYIGARIAQNVTELDRVNKEIEVLEAAAGGIGVVDLYMTDAQIAAKLQAFKDYRKQLLEQMTGMSEETRALAEEEAKHQAQVDSARYEAGLAMNRDYAQSVKNIRDQRVKDLESAVKAEGAAEKAALAGTKKVKDERLAIERKYAEAISQLGSGVGGDPSFAAVQDLKVSSRQALQRGDFDSAKKQADAALAMLLELQAAGANTYGFVGIANEFKAIELAANDLEQSNADAKLEAIRSKIAGLKEEAAQLQNISITLDLPATELERVKAQLQALSSTPVLIPVQIVFPEMAAIGLQSTAPVTFPPPATPGFASGGFIRGPGSGTSDSILARLSDGEYVLRAAAVRKYGTALLDRLNGLRMPGFAEGGFVSELNSPSFLQPAQPSALGTLSFHLPDGEQFAVQVAGGDNWGDLHRASLKYGRPGRKR